jgi:hypothetical protein
VKEDEGEDDHAGRPLNDRQRTRGRSRTRGARPLPGHEEEAVDPVKEDRKRDQHDLERDRERQRLETRGDLVVGVGSA